MTEDDSKIGRNEIAIQVSITRSFEEGQGVTWTTTLLQSASLKEINTVMDKIWAAATRQSKWNRIDRIDKEVEHLTQQMSQLQYSIVSLEARHHDWSRAPSDAKTAYTQTKENIIRQKTLIEGLVTEQSRMRAELG